MKKGWPLVRLGEVLQHRKEFIEIDDDQTYKRCRVQLHAQGVVLRDQLPGLEIKTKKQQVCRAGEFLVAEIDAKHGGYGIVPDDLQGAIVSSHYFLFGLNNDKLHRGFLQFFQRTPAFAEQVAAQGSTNYAAIRPSHVLAYTIPLPPIEEQRRIVVRIEALATKIADVRKLQDEVSDSRNVLVKQIVDSVTDTNEHPHLPIAELLREPTLNGIGLRPSDSPPGHRILRISAGTSRADATVDEEDAKFIEVPDRDVEKYRLQSGDLLACRFNGNLRFVGRFSRFVGQSSELRLYPDKLIRFRVDTAKVTPEYVCVAMNSRRGREKIESFCATTAGNIGISATNLKTVVIPVPPLVDQRQIVAYLNDVSAKTEALKSQRQQSAAELKALLPSLLDRAFKGEI
jgi:type I restriction enzyme S subunit